VDDEVYSDLGELADELPEHAPRFVLLSYPLTLVRLQIPLYHTPSPQLHLRLLSCKLEMLIVQCTTGLRPPIRPLRHAVLPTNHMQRRSQDAVCWRQGVDAEYSRG
jgi:hypothetical protein